MHMADALISPSVGGTLWAVSAGIIAYCSKKVRAEMSTDIIPLMGVLGAFIFSAQMINFTIPGTGSSGHLGGGLILAVLLGPHAAILAIASILVVQAFFFADGGLLALGCNIFNLGFFPAFIAYPFFYKKIAGKTPSSTRISAASLVAAIIGVQLGAFSVVAQTVFSGVSSLPFSLFASIMQPIHLAIGVVEGLVSASVISFVYKARPEMLRHAYESSSTYGHSIRNMALGFLVAAILTGGVISWFASDHPDGLDWSISKVTGLEKLAGPDREIYTALSLLQEKVAFMPDYVFRKKESTKPAGWPSTPPPENSHKPGSTQPDGSKIATSVSGIVGGVITLLLSLMIGCLLKRGGQTG
ncbi:MAG: energy-coupling factor ABC transporter permease [Desulfuromonadaceae bacterium]|nr:energy-coupling factor ABC transporter permease [Desulfuromonadaceae bacterium]